MKKCSVPGCDNKLSARGWCNTHWRRWQRHKDVAKDKPIKGIPVKCSAQNCNKMADSLGLCEAHYARLKRSGKVSDKPIFLGSPGRWNPNWKGGIRKIKGRIYIYAPDHTQANYYGLIPRARHVLELAIGRTLKPHPLEVVHHKNGDITDDRLENLELLSQAEHIRKHIKQGRLIK